MVCASGPEMVVQTQVVKQCGKYIQASIEENAIHHTTTLKKTKKKQIKDEKSNKIEFLKTGHDSLSLYRRSRE